MNGNAIGTAPQFVVGSSSATNFIVANNGYVGIGSTSPNYALDVNGDVNVASGKCFRVNGICIGYVTKLAAIYATSSVGTTTVSFGNGGPTFSNATLTLPASTTQMIVEVWGAGGGGGQAYAGAGPGKDGGTSCFGSNSVACSSPIISATGGGGGSGNFGAAGSGGTGSGGDINMTGGGGQGGAAGNVGGSTVYNPGGIGGSAPLGGQGGNGPAWNGAGNPGSPFGGGGAGGGVGVGDGNGSGSGGGAGGYAKKLISSPSGNYYFSVAKGGAGGSGGGGNGGGAGGNGGFVVTVYATSSPTASGNDYAEMFPVSNPGITAGDIVAVDAGVPVSMKLASPKVGAPLAGIISTNPGQVLGDQNAAGQRPVALSGRVPAKVNLEGGPIAIGDRIAPSSVPGVGKKAGPFDDSVGIALETFSGDPSTSSGQAASQGSVTVFLDLQRGINIDQIGMTLLGTSATTTAGTPFDFVGNLLSAIASRITAPAASTSDATSTSATSTSVTSTPSIADSFFGALFSRIAQWFADTTNGIKEFFAASVHTQEICTRKSDGTNVCVSGDHLATLLASAGQSPAASSSSPPTPATSDSATNTPPVISINGNNPAHINIGDTYADLGATITGPEADLNLGIKTFLNGALVSNIVLDTSTTTTATIDYVVTDQNGLTSTSSRTVIVEATAAADLPPSTEETPPPTEPTPPAPDTTATTTTTSTTATTTEATPAGQ